MDRHSRSPRRALGLAVAVLAMAGLCLAPAHATTLVRTSLEDLTTSSSAVVVGEVVDAYSYWNADGSFILTDVVVETTAQLKGRATKEARRTVTVLGGTVDDLSTLIVGGPRLEIGRSYVLFLSTLDLTGHPGATTIPDHAQGVFDLVESADGGLRAISQATSLHLVPDLEGRATAPGGPDGMAFDQFLAIVSDTARSDRQEVRR